MTRFPSVKTRLISSSEFPTRKSGNSGFLKGGISPESVRLGEGPFGASGRGESQFPTDIPVCFGVGAVIEWARGGFSGGGSPVPAVVRGVAVPICPGPLEVQEPYLRVYQSQLLPLCLRQR